MEDKHPQPQAKPPATMEEAFAGTHPLKQMLAKTLEDLGGQEFLNGWAEEYPTEYVRIMIGFMPDHTPAAQKQEPGMHLHLHPGLQAGPLDRGPVVATQEGDSDSGH